MDLHDEDKKQVPKSLESELSSLLGDISGTTNKGKERSVEGDSQIREHKKRALTLKRQGKLAEAKEELKKAKILEKQLEEQELLVAAEDSDEDEISALIRSMGDDNEDDLFGSNVQDSAFDVDRLMSADDIGFDNHMEVTDKDLMDPELTATLKSLGWNDESDFAENITANGPMTRAALEKEIFSLKREALQLKRAGNITEAMAQLKKAKKLEKDLESLTAGPDFLTDDSPMTIVSAPISQSNNAAIHGVKKSVPKSRMMIQKELPALEKKALALRREGRVDEAEEELKKGTVLEEQLTEMDKAPQSNTKWSNVGKKDMDLEYSSITGDTQVGEEVEQDITDQDMHDPTYLSILRNFGWKDEENEVTDSPPKPPSSVPKAAVDTPVRSKRSKAEVRRELLSLKRKALGLRREGKIDEGDEVLRSAKILETEIAEMEAPKAPALASNRPMDDIVRLPNVTAYGDEVEDDVTEKGIEVPPAAPKSKQEIQRDLLGLKRNALTLRRKGETKEAEELLQKAKVLEAQLEELEGTQKESVPKPSTDVKPKITDSLIVHEKKEHSKPGEAMAANLVLDSQEKDVETFMGSGGKQTEDKDLLLGETFVTGADAAIRAMARSQDPSPTKASNMIDLLTGDAPGTLHVPAEEQGKKLSASDMPNNSREILKGRKDETSAGFDVPSLQRGKLEETKYSPKKPSTDETDSKKLASPNSQNLHDEVLARKRKAVTLKRDGKLSEAMEELRQAKLLEKSIDQETSAMKNATSMPNAPIQQKEAVSGKMASKPVSGRDRFKLQQESLKHKRQAMKLRREGNMEEAEAEFELAKNLEAQLDEMSSQDTSKTDVTTDDVMVEDLLDPQLLSALRAIGIADTNVSTTPQAPERPAPVKSTPINTDSIIPERSQLEDRIKAEKVKAINLKRQGKQAEALDALRCAKLYERKLNSLNAN